MRAGSAVLLTALVGLGAGCGAHAPPRPAPRVDAAAATPCADFELDVERFWSTSAKAEVRAGILKTGGAIDTVTVERVVTKMDAVSRDWVMMQEAVCKDTVVRKVMPAEVYNKVSMCLRAALVSQRTLVEMMRTPTRDMVYKADDALARLRQDTGACQKDAVYDTYARETDDRDTATAREALGQAHAYALLADRKRLGQRLDEGIAAARRGRAARVLVDLLVEDSARWTRDEVDLEKAKVRASEARDAAEKDRYEAGVAAAYHALGLAEDAAGRYAESLRYFMLALGIRERVLGKDHTETARTYQGIGAAHVDDMSYDAAIEWFERARAIRERGGDNPDVAHTYNTLGNAHLHRDRPGDQDEAIRWYRRALDVKEKVYGKDHPTTAVTLNNLGGAYQNKGKYDDALALHERALDVFGRTLGEDHPNVAATMNNLALVLVRKGDHAAAMRWYRRAEAMMVKRLGGTHPTTLQLRENIDALCKKQPEVCQKR